MGVAVAPSTILRWVIRYTEDFVRRSDTFELIVGRSWRADETYIKVKGGWVYLYRDVDERGSDVDGLEPSHAALRRMDMRNEFKYRGIHPVKIRSWRFFINIVEP